MASKKLLILRKLRSAVSKDAPTPIQSMVNLFNLSARRGAMNIHEYQAKELLARYGVAVPRGGVAYTTAEAVEVARRLGGQVWVVKAQIHAGGRGKAGGVERIVEIELDREEKAAFDKSAAAVHELIEVVKGMKIMG